MDLSDNTLLRNQMLAYFFRIQIQQNHKTVNAIHLRFFNTRKLC